MFYGLKRLRISVILIRADDQQIFIINIKKNFVSHDIDVVYFDLAILSRETTSVRCRAISLDQVINSLSCFIVINKRCIAHGSRAMFSSDIKVHATVTHCYKLFISQENTNNGLCYVTNNKSRKRTL